MLIFVFSPVTHQQDEAKLEEDCLQIFLFFLFGGIVLVSVSSGLTLVQRKEDEKCNFSTGQLLPRGGGGGGGGGVPRGLFARGQRLVSSPKNKQKNNK